MEIGPEHNLCEAINTLPPGEELVLRPGEYRGPCLIRGSGTPDHPLVVRAKDPATHPRIVHAGEHANVFTVRGSHVTIRGLAFGPTPPGVDAIRARSADFLTIEECEFQGVGGNAIAASHRDEGRGLRIRRNRILDSQGTAIYIGCHDGIRCALTEVLVEENYINGVDAPDPQIGYGLQFKLNTWGWIRDNVIINTKGPGIMVYGATLPGRVSVIERNAVTGSRRSAAIVVGGGPAIVSNNVATESDEGGIQLEDYRRRGLLQGIAIVHNTVYDNGMGGITVPDSARMTDIRIVNNAVYARPGTPAYPANGKGIVSLGNVNCALVRCFRDADRRDFSPAPGSPLTGAAALQLGDWMPRDDFTGAPRSHSPSVGAFDGPAWPIPNGFKPMPPSEIVR